MKISKLFHWLYAILMLAPVCAVGITCLTHVFNEEVQAETQIVEIEYQYQTETPLENAPLKDGYMYTCTLDNNSINNFASYYVLITNKDTNEVVFEWETIDLQEPYVWIEQGNDDNIWLFLDIWDDNEEQYILHTLAYVDNDNQYNLTITASSYIAFNEGININNYFGFFSTPNELRPIKNVEINTVAQDDSTNIFYTSCEQVKDSFLLSWCNSNNPARDVMNYGSALFNVPIDNLMNYFLTYWVSVSIIWLIFDVFMYVPLLVHRWIDKAKLE